MSATSADATEVISAFTAASTGEPKAIHQFFQIFLRRAWLVPDRVQTESIANAAPPSNEFATLLGIKDGGRIIVPIFSSREFADEWARRELTYTECTGRELVRRIPAAWWGWLNIGQEWSKELSPWEIEKLQIGGEEAIPELIADLVEGEQFAEPTFAPLTAEQLERLRGGVKQVLGTARGIEKVLSVQQFSSDAPASLRRIIVGVELAATNSHGEEMREQLQNELARAQIGAEPAEVVLSGTLGWQLYADALRTGTELFGRPLGVWAKLKRFVATRSSR